MEKKKAIYIISIFVVTFLTCIFAVAFAYIGKPNTPAYVNINASIDNKVGGVNFQYTGHTSMALTVTVANSGVATATNNYTKYKDSSTRNTTVQLTSDPAVFPNGVTCSYDIVYTPTVAYRETPAATSAGLRELVIYGKIGSTNYFETNIAGDQPIILYTRLISTSSSSSTTSEKWQLYGRYYNLNIDQSQASGQNPQGVISYENGYCRGNT